VPGIDWHSCAIQISESQWETIPKILESRLSDAAALGTEALRVWEARFAPHNVIAESLKQLVQLARSRPAGHDERSIQQNWGTRAFYRLNGWTLEQRIARKLSRYVSHFRGLRARGVAQP
jgi:hypothetical protein